MATATVSTTTATTTAAAATTPTTTTTTTLPHYHTNYHTTTLITTLPRYHYHTTTTTLPLPLPLPLTTARRVAMNQVNKLNEETPCIKTGSVEQKDNHCFMSLTFPSHFVRCSYEPRKRQPASSDLRSREDLDEVLLMVSQTAPGRPIAVVGFSCGSGYAGRYGALRSHLSAWTDEACG